GKKQRKIPKGEIVYTDAIRLERPLFSKKLQIVGKPDFVIVRGRDYIPIEFKSSKSPMKPYRGHVLQLAAYCWLLEEKTGSKVKHGVIVYGDGKKFRINYDERLRSDLIYTVSEMRELLKADLNYALKFAANNGRKCKSCNIRERCEEIRKRAAQ
ncbi:MAG: CRISPR-associated protein Cas4, partial [Archaeoglobaceae archaeon]|nr:CRISPR-associated protein Cas4 [Archaeoglobaceae archaeon]MDW8118575.1 CRISPR-associated protein Cas4 [Archaeoglobaceae archaeon]